jgi:hypothetical protein
VPNYEELANASLSFELVPFMTTAQSKPAMVQSLYSALHDDGWRLLPDQSPNREQKREFDAFRAMQSPTTMRWKYEAAKGEHDDFVIAVGLSIAAAMRPSIGVITVLD